MLDKVKQFVAQAFKADRNSEALIHFERTVYYAQQLEPDSDEPILIAAYAHDLERAVCTETSVEMFKDHAWDDPELLASHQEKGATMIKDFLDKQGYDPTQTARVYKMVRHHEEGGDVESDLIKDADSLSYLETNAYFHAKNFVAELGTEKIRQKFVWMYERTSSEQTKRLAKPLYEKALASLPK